MNKKVNKIFIICGPSGVGKDTVMKELEKLGLPLKRTTTTTSRDMRPGEEQGNPYYFVSTDKFQSMIESGEMAEYAKVFDSWKGITKAELDKSLKEGQNLLLQIEHQGAKTVKSLYPDQTIVIVITPNSIEELNQRLINRGDRQEEELEKRLEQNKNWKEDYKDFDYFVNNPDGHPEIAAQEIAGIIKEHIG